MRLCPPASGAETKEEAWGKGVLHPQPLSYFESKISVKQFSEVRYQGNHIIQILRLNYLLIGNFLEERNQKRGSEMMFSSMTPWVGYISKSIQMNFFKKGNKSL